VNGSGGESRPIYVILCENLKNESEKIMAENVRPGTKIVFADNVERTVYPVSLRLLRTLNEVMKDLQVEEDTLSEETIDRMVDAAVVVFQQVDPELAKDRDAVEDLVDIRTFNQLVGAAMGADPNA